MIFYDEEDKELHIPNGLGNLNFDGTDYYNSGYTNGREYQEIVDYNKLTSTTIRENGTFTADYGWSSVKVGIDFTPALMSGYTEGYGRGYSSGSTDGFNSGYTNGRAEGFNSGYTNGLSEGFTSGYTNGQTEGFDSGYTNGLGEGFESGYTNGLSEGFESGYTNGQTEGFTSGYTNGLSEGFESGYTNGTAEGFESGYTNGLSEGFTSGYTNGLEEGFNSGYTNGLSEGFESGYTNGSAEGFEEGYASGSTDGYSAGYDSGFTKGYTSGATDGYRTGYETGKLVGQSGSTVFRGTFTVDREITIPYIPYSDDNIQTALSYSPIKGSTTGNNRWDGVFNYQYVIGQGGGPMEPLSSVINGSGMTLEPGVSYTYLAILKYFTDYTLFPTPCTLGDSTLFRWGDSAHTNIRIDFERYL